MIGANVDDGMRLLVSGVIGTMLKMKGIKKEKGADPIDFVVDLLINAGLSMLTEKGLDVEAVEGEAHEQHQIQSV